MLNDHASCIDCNRISYYSIAHSSSVAYSSKYIDSDNPVYFVHLPYMADLYSEVQNVCAHHLFFL